MRLAPQPGERIDRSREIKFRFDGHAVVAHPGDTISSALLAAGWRVMSRSFKYHRPRGELCCAGRCGNSLVDVDGWPGVRGCSEPAREGACVSSLNAWPSLRFDALRIVDLIGGPLTPPGFYYKTFIRPRRLWPIYESMLRRVAGLGRLPANQPDRQWSTEYRRRHCDVMVIGGGVAGMTAALAAAQTGADVVLVDDDLEPGGCLLSEGRHGQARALARSLTAAGVEVLAAATALGFFDGLVPVWQGSTLHQVRAHRHVAATGTIEQPLIFPNNDLPGVMLASGARRLAALYGVAAGRRVVAAVSSDAGIDDSLALAEAGIEVTAIADLRAAPGSADLRSRVDAAGISYEPERTVVRAVGRRGVRGAVIAQVDHAGRMVAGTERRLACDGLVVNGGAIPSGSLLLQAGAKGSFDAATGAFRAGDLPAGIHAAGSVAGYTSADAAAVSGAVAGLACAAELGLGGTDLRERFARERRRLEGLHAPPAVASPPPLATDGRRGRAFVDLDEDVTVKDIAYAADEGYDSIELIKRYTTVTMGPSQGRFSQLPAIRALAAATGDRLDEIGITTARPPWLSVPLGILAGRPHEPAKRSAIHARHRELGANVLWAGEWRRAYDYGDPEAEAMAVHRSAGLIDVSTLGKLIVRGPDAGTFLDRLYPNRLSNLRPGRVRYGVLVSEAGRITDDGTICRLDDETFYVTTTSSGAGAVEQWFAWWLAEWNLDVSLTDVTQGLAAVNLAGPASRAILSRLTDIDCSNESFSYLDARETTAAGVRCLALRIGFVGELGYELHFPAAHGTHLWDTILAEGAPEGIRPFGLEPQRILRLQKMHILVGQDTDSESMPTAAGMPWIVKLDKEADFIGRWALERAADGEPETTLVGYVAENGSVPTEGSVVLAGGRANGQVTSARRSPKLERVIGLAWVPTALAVDGAEIEIADGGSRRRGWVCVTPFYDPEGEVLRS